MVRVGGTAGQLTAVASTSDGTAVAGTDYTGVTNLLTFNEGETLQTFVVPIIRFFMCAERQKSMS